MAGAAWRDPRSAFNVAVGQPAAITCRTAQRCTGWLLLCAISLPLIFRAQSLAALLALVPILGLGVATVTPVTNALVADLVEQRSLGAAMGVFGTILDIGEAAGPIVAGFLVGHLAYGASFDIIAAVIVVFLIIFMFSVRDLTAANVPPDDSVTNADKPSSK